MDPSLSSLLGFPLQVDSHAVDALRQLRAEDKFTDLPGTNTADEKLRCTAKVNEMLDRLISGIQQHPRKSWVLEQFVPTLESACQEDTEARERFEPYLERVMDVLGIESSDGMLNHYLAFGGDDAA